MKKLPCGANLKRDFLRFYKRNSFKNAMPNTQYFAILKKNALFPCEIAGPNWLYIEYAHRLLLLKCNIFTNVFRTKGDTWRGTVKRRLRNILK
jgi:hypothetical protein